MKAVQLLYLTLALVGCSLTQVHAQKADSTLVNEEGSEIDSVLKSIDQVNSALINNPASELYHNLWESSNIRYPQSAFNCKNDTIRIILAGNSLSPYVHPYQGKVLSKFGPRNGRMHTGTDVKLNSGDSVLCAFDGKVRLARVFNGYGNMVLVRHNNGLETIYGHLKKIGVHVNDTVKAGDLIGYGGRTGRATCDHLHFETRLFGDPFDSNKYIDFETGKLKGDTLYCLNKKVSIHLDDLQLKPIPPNDLASKTKNTPQGTEGIHVIEPGDNLWTIAKIYNTSVKNLCLINNITARQILKIGMVLYVQ
ncbi:MAG: peptidoglycan DD-metalloendopeptidase family protein [Prolixibacteraceae bacterium]